jgi:hypothetical protein
MALGSARLTLHREESLWTMYCHIVALVKQ